MIMNLNCVPLLELFIVNLTLFLTSWSDKTVQIMLQLSVLIKQQQLVEVEVRIDAGDVCLNNDIRVLGLRMATITSHSITFIAPSDGFGAC